MSWLTDPWATGFIARAGLALILVGVVGGVVGVFVVLRGLPFTLEALAHAMFPGAIIAAAAGGPIVIGALAAGMVAAGGIAAVSRPGRAPDETAVGVVFTGLFALGVLLFSALGPLEQDVDSFLFGSLFGVSTTDLVVSLVVSVVVLGVVVATRHRLVATTFDREAAAGEGIHVRRTDLMLLAIIALAVVVSVRAVGNVLVLAQFVTPAASARLVGRRLPVTVLLAAMYGVASGLGGLYLSYHAGIAAGGAVVLVGTAMFLLTWIASPRSGLPAYVHRARAVQPARP